MTCLVVDDEPVVRAIHAAMLGDVTGQPVVAVGSLEEARAVLAHATPTLVLLDLELGGEQGLMLLPELGQLSPPPRTVVVSSHIPRYLEAIRRAGSLLCLAKPLTLDHLRAVAGRARASADAMPFTPAEFLQIACLGKHSVELRCRLPESDDDATIVVHEGQVWSAARGARRGVEVFMDVVAEPHVRVRVRALEGEPPARDVAGGWEALLLEAMRRHDEREERRRIDFSSEISEVFGAAVPRSDPPPPPEAKETFDDLVREGQQAVVRRDMETAIAAFERALGLHPGHSMVQHNVRRLRELGYGRKLPVA